MNGMRMAAIRSLIAFSAPVLLGWLSGGGLAAAQPSREIRIGVITDLSAKMPTWGAQTARGARLAEQDLRAEGMRVRLLVEDHQMSSARGVSALRKLIDVDGADALYIEFSLVASALAPPLRKEPVPVIFNAPIEAGLAGAGHLFRSYTDVREMCGRLARRWKGQRIDRIGLLRIASESGDLCRAGLEEQYERIEDQLVNAGDDPAPLLLRMRSHGVEAIANMSLEPDQLTTLALIERLALKFRIGALDNMFNDVARRRFARALEQVDAFGYARIDQHFRLRLADAPAESLEAAALSYTHLKQLARAAHECGFRDLACKTAVLARSPADMTIGFEGWEEQRARYHYKIRSWRNGEKVDVDG